MTTEEQIKKADRAWEDLADVGAMTSPGDFLTGVSEFKQALIKNINDRQNEGKIVISHKELLFMISTTKPIE